MLRLPRCEPRGPRILLRQLLGVRPGKGTRVGKHHILACGQRRREIDNKARFEVGRGNLSRKRA
jgi:hypothetical protein